VAPLVDGLQHESLAYGVVSVLAASLHLRDPALQDVLVRFGMCGPLEWPGLIQNPRTSDELLAASRTRIEKAGYTYLLASRLRHTAITEEYAEIADPDHLAWAVRRALPAVAGGTAGPNLEDLLQITRNPNLALATALLLGSALLEFHSSRTRDELAGPSTYAAPFDDAIEDSLAILRENYPSRTKRFTVRTRRRPRPHTRLLEDPDWAPVTDMPATDFVATFPATASRMVRGALGTSPASWRSMLTLHESASPTTPLHELLRVTQQVTA
jgi:hypothetical protein